MNQAPPVLPPENIQLLDGYNWTPGISKDAEIGKIGNKAGFSILFDRSAVKGFYAQKFSSKDDFISLKHQEVNGQQLDLAFLKNDEIVALFDKTTRFSAKLNSTSDLIDFLLTVMTFGSRKTTVRDVSSSREPVNIKLLDGYVYESRRGIDSHVGAIKRKDGFEITHDIGGMAGNYADEYFPEHFEYLKKQTHLNPVAIERQIQFLQNQIEWRQRQKINGDDVMIVLLKDSRLIASFVNSNANFIAKIDSHDKIADFFPVVLTYQPSTKTTTR